MWTLLVATLLAAEPTVPQGGVVAPAVLPAGTNAIYGVVGAPDLGVGYRQGFDLLEVEGRALFNVFQLSVIVDGGVKLKVFSREKLLISAGGALGLEFDSGSRYFDKANFGAVFLRPRLDATVSYELNEILTGVAQLDVPVAVGLGVQGQKFNPLLGLGGEVNLGGRLSLLVLGALGLDVVKEPLGVTQVRTGWAIRFGVGYRLF